LKSLKLKYEATQDTLDKLSAENASYKKRTNYIDEEKKQLIDNLKQKDNQFESIQYENEILQNSINNLKQEIKKQKQNELLLLKYPDFYGPMDHLHIEGEIDVYEDMQNQINANQFRISLLENLNRKLETSIKKLKEARPPSHKAQSYLPNNNFSEESGFNSSMTNKDSTLGDNLNFFMKPQPETSSSRRSSIVLPEKPSRPFPLYKLESELDEDESNKLVQQKSAKSNSFSWTNDESSLINTNSKERLEREFNFNEQYDEDFDFMKDKHKSDQSYLEKLNQIAQTSDILRIENSDSSMKKFHGRSNLHSPFLYSPSQVNSIRNETETNFNRNNTSRASNYSAKNAGSLGNNSVVKNTPPIPPADRNFEMIVGKGRRVSSALGGGGNASSRSNSANANNREKNKLNGAASNGSTARNSSVNNNLIQNKQNGSNSSLSNNNSQSYKCENCSKKYDNNKDLDIHKLYCS
jgi:hypothetical protein